MVSKVDVSGMTEHEQGRAAHIIWQNNDQNVTIIDIPRSIEDAQCEGESTSPLRIISTAPIAIPFTTPEPKSEAARARLRARHPEQDEHRIYAWLWTQVAQELAQVCNTAWYLDRIVGESGDGDGQRRKRKHEAHGVALADTFQRTSTEHISCARITGDEDEDVACDIAGLDLTDWPAIHNSSTAQLRLQLDQSQARVYTLPPRSSLLCEHITSSTQASALRQALRSRHGSTARLDLIVLDPPWHNASVKRSRQYGTSAPLQAADILAATDLDMLLNDQCLVAVWITNKASARAAVLGEHGIFAQWGVQLIEEWVWFKVTASHELMFPMDTVMRKPYEVLLIGRKHRAYPVPRPPEPLPRRALLAVPDLHSRKPCLKKLLEPLLVRSKDYHALEVFARHLVAGWWSWGDECVLFNDMTHWKHDS